MKSQVAILLVAVAVAIAVPSVEARKWTSKKGTTLEAELIEQKPGIVVLKDETGKVREVKIELLSPADQEYVKSLNQPAADAPVADAPVADAPPARSPRAVPKPAEWTMNPEELLPPDTPLSGTLFGQPFRIDEAELQDGMLIVRSGGTLNGRSITVHLFPKAGESIVEKSYRMPSTVGLRAPIVKVTWRQGIVPQSETYLGDYALFLELGKPDNDRLPGKLYLCLPDSSKSILAGKFAAKILPPDSPLRK